MYHIKIWNYKRAKCWIFFSPILHHKYTLISAGPRKKHTANTFHSAAACSQSERYASWTFPFKYLFSLWEQEIAFTSPSLISYYQLLRDQVTPPKPQAHLRISVNHTGKHTQNPCQRWPGDNTPIRPLGIEALDVKLDALRDKFSGAKNCASLQFWIRSKLTNRKYSNFTKVTRFKIYSASEQLLWILFASLFTLSIYRVKLDQSTFTSLRS